MDWDAVRGWVAVGISVLAFSLSGLAYWSSRRWRARPLVQVELDQFFDSPARVIMPYREVQIANRGNAPVHDFRVEVTWGFGELFGDQSDVGTVGADEVVRVLVGHILPYFEDAAHEHEVSLSVDPEQLRTAKVVVSWRQPPDFKRVVKLPIDAKRKK